MFDFSDTKKEWKQVQVPGLTPGLAATLRLGLVNLVAFALLKRVAAGIDPGRLPGPVLVFSGRG